MNYQETLDYLYTQLPMYQRQGKTAFKKDLTNIKKLCEALKNPQEKYPTIHIAGTNGKGSTAHLIAAVLQARGLNVGLYTSPHYRDFRERIKINGEYIGKRTVSAFVKKHQALFAEIQPSFFEITVAMAFEFFKKQKVDIAVIETGLGGRLDSTNILRPKLSVITNISYDHQQFLGETLPEIAGEKAGIIKENTPVVIGERQEEVAAVFIKKAEEQNAPIVFADEQLEIVGAKNAKFGRLFKVTYKGRLLFKNLHLGLEGSFQEKNMLTALQSILHYDQMEGIDTALSFRNIQYGFQRVKSLTNFIGRWEILGETPTIISDSAHNEAGLQRAMKEIEDLGFEVLHIVLGMVKDKDIEKVLQLFPKDALYYFAKPAIPRGLEASILQEKAAKMGLEGDVYTSVKKALEAAKTEAAAEDLIYVGGSTFVVAEVV